MLEELKYADPTQPQNTARAKIDVQSSTTNEREDYTIAVWQEDPSLDAEQYEFYDHCQEYQAFDQVENSEDAELGAPQSNVESNHFERPTGNSMFWLYRTFPHLR